ncbi:MAG: phosphoglucomutase/phosphomannomutase family protein, partial [Candidatus Omnitrophica bacterium]|nr:phosphoglucomutase/phosphomannomutase family protein [Candidatus Omnitrophota bacterium]
MASTTTQIKFGTDGWRAIIGDTYTYENVRIVTQAVADYIGAGKKVAIGFDTRFMSGKFAEASAVVLKSNGIEVVLSDRCAPTPALSFAVK